MSASINDAAIPGLNKALIALTRIPSRIALRCAQRFNRRKDELWRAGKDLYGIGWAPLKPSTIRRKRGDARILIREDNLRPATKFIARAGSGIAFVVGESGIYAQRGDPGRNRVPRRVVPDAGLPAAFRKIVDEEAQREAKRIMSR